MATRDDIVAAARSYIGVPWRHQGRTRRRGVDCFGLVIRAAADCGITVPDEAGYSRSPDGVSILDGMRARFDPIRLADVKPGDVLGFAELVYPCHIGIAAPGRTMGALNVIHAHVRRRKVLEEPLAQEWGARLRLAASFRGLEDPDR
jgi:cell wall-associated NlpC family hydrolase